MNTALRIGLPFFSFFTVSCAPTQFQSSKKSEPLDTSQTSTSTNSQVNSHTKTGVIEKLSFEVFPQRPNLDVILVVDTGGTISESDAQIIQKKLKSFTGALGARTSTKFALIAHNKSENPKTGFDASALSSSLPVEQVSTPNLSNISVAQLTLAAAAATTCPKEQNFRSNSASGEKLTLCGVQSSNSLAYRGQELIDELSGKLSSFVRSGAKRVYVFIAKDDAFTFLDRDFIEATSKSNAGVSPIVFAFTKKQNTVFNNVTSATGGELFEISSQSWETHFDSMLAKIFITLGTEKDLPTENVSLVPPVQINGRDVAMDCFKVIGKKLFVSLNCIPNNSGKAVPVNVSFNRG